MNLQETERAAAAFATHARVALADIEGKITARYDLNAGELISAAKCPGHSSLDILSICILVMQNGFAVIGKSAPASGQNFNADLGRKFAYEDALRQLWPLEGYLLRDRLNGS